MFERTMLSNEKFLSLKKSLPQDTTNSFRDTYVLELLHLPDNPREKDLRKAIAQNITKFLLEFGRDYAFMGEEYPVQVGDQDFAIDLLFYNRSLNCLVAIELKTDKFKPEHLGQLNFYLEALDRDVRKPHENPSIGILLCNGKNDTVVEYALSRSLSPTLVADYQTQLPDKKLLQAKWQEVLESLSIQE
jgi:predicted nuclease of restriction endonuclease-like (RecB) superfamily